MGFKELVASGSYVPNRITVNVPPGSSTGGIVQGPTADFGSTYVLLGMFAQRNCRVRLYSTSESVALDSARAPFDFTIDPAVGLNLEVFLSGSERTITFDPPVIATTFADRTTWFNVSSSIGNPNVQFTAYQIQPRSTSLPELTIGISASIASGSSVSGSLDTVSKSFLIRAASGSEISRLRLYSTDVTLISSTEKERPFGTQPPSSSKLITDLMFDSASFLYKINPVLEGYTWAGDDYKLGTNTIGYILQNRTAATAAVTASVLILSLED